VNKTEIDVKRMIPFGLAFVFATEYIPLIIIFAPQLIPSTCVTPTQLVRYVAALDLGFLVLAMLPTNIRLTNYCATLF